MYDSDFINEESRAFAGRVPKEAGAGSDEQVERAFLLAFGGAPTAEEMRDARG